MFSSIRRRTRHESSLEVSLSPSVVQQHQAELIEIDARGTVYSVAFLTDGKSVVSGGPDGSIRHWRAEDGTEAGTPTDAGSAVCSIGVSHEGKWFASGLGNGEVLVWNAESHKVVEFRKHQHAVCAVDVSPDGTRIATGSHDQVACVWTLSTGKRVLGPWKHDSPVVGAKFSPDGHLVAFGVWRDSIHIYDGQHGHVVVDFPIKVVWSLNQSLAWGNDSKQLYALSDEGDVVCLDVSNGTVLSQWSIHNTEPRSIALASNGTFIAASAGPSVSFWDTTTHTQIGSIVQHTTRIESMAISANYDLVIGGGNKISLRSLCEILPLSCYDNIFSERAVQRMKKLDKIIESLRVKQERSNSENAHLQELVNQLRSQLSDSQRRADDLDKAMESLRAQDSNKIAHLEHQLHDSVQILCAHEQTRRCEALYTEDRIIAAAVSLLKMTNTVSEEVRTNSFIMDWMTKFKSQCILSLEVVGDEASGAEKHDQAVEAYSTALTLRPPTPNTLLSKWARTVLIRSAAKDALSNAAKFKLPPFVIYRAICDVLEERSRISEAVACFHQLVSELGEDMGKRDATDETEWVASFKTRCLKTLEEHGNVAMDSDSYEDAIDHYTTALTLKPLSINLLTKRSKARTAIGLWEDALRDADVAINLDPSSPHGYKRKYAALFGCRRYDDAINAHNDMLLKIEQSIDPVTRKLRNNYASSSQTIATIRTSVKQTQRGAPLVLINTETGRLCDQQAQLDVFEADPKFKELVASVTTILDNTRIIQTTQQYFRYATFSHTWDGAEPLYHDILHRSVDALEPSPTVVKLLTFCVKAREAGLRWAWSDTCCINKSDSSALQESLTSMFKWYHGSALTIVHLKGVLSVSELDELRRSFWNTRAWTLQEFFASRVIRFYTEDWKRYRSLESADNDKDSLIIMAEMATANGVDAQLLLSLRPGSENVRQKLCLAATRTATKQEDVAYSLFGIFKVSIPVTYGEGQEHALGRLLQEVLTRSGDVTILAWTGKASEYNSSLPAEIGVYREPASLYIPSPIGDDKMEALVAELQAPTHLNSAVALYDQVVTLPSPRLVSQRLSLSCIVFPLKGQAILSSNSRGVYSATTSALGNVEIKTTEDLSDLKNLVLVHPWLKCLLNPALPSEDPVADSDTELPSPLSPLNEDSSDGDPDILSPSSSHSTFPSRDKLTRALRLFACLRQPFGALLLLPLSHNEYKRVACDHPITVRLLQNVSPWYLVQKIQTLDIL